MNRKNIYCRRYYKSVHTLSYYKDKITKKELLQIPFTEKIKNQIVAIPLNTSMNKKEIKYLFKNINFFLNKILNYLFIFFKKSDIFFEDSELSKQ